MGTADTYTFNDFTRERQAPHVPPPHECWRISFSILTLSAKSTWHISLTCLTTPSVSSSTPSALLNHRMSRLEDRVAKLESNLALTHFRDVIKIFEGSLIKTFGPRIYYKNLLKKLDKQIITYYRRNREEFYKMPKSEEQRNKRHVFKRFNEIESKHPGFKGTVQYLREIQPLH